MSDAVLLRIRTRLYKSHQIIATLKSAIIYLGDAGRDYNTVQFTAIGERIFPNALNPVRDNHTCQTATVTKRI